MYKIKDWTIEFRKEQTAYPLQGVVASVPLSRSLKFTIDKPLQKLYISCASKLCRYQIVTTKWNQYYYVLFVREYIAAIPIFVAERLSFFPGLWYILFPSEMEELQDLGAATARQISINPSILPASHSNHYLNGFDRVKRCNSQCVMHTVDYIMLTLLL